ncbi:MAG: amidohydrolase family protein [Chloroflexi bacterium]|nr:amidohydrolase family protein [Chloroflexota bacterium]
MQIDGRLVADGRAVLVETDGPRIARIQETDSAASPMRWIAPGLIDVQVNGFAGHDVNAPDVTPATIAELVRSLWRRGVTALCPTVITAPESAILQALRAIDSACSADPLIAHSVPCIHVEGPFISADDGPRGAHSRDYVRPPDYAEVERWQAAARGRLGIVTVAPELSHACELIEHASSDGLLVSIGHTAASSEQVRAAVDAGARVSTHLGNGAHAVLPRHPNYIWEQLADDRLIAGLIFDGHHLPPAVMKTMLRAKTLDRVVLVSDCSALGGLPPGVYETPVGGRVELTADNRLTLYGSPFLAGAASPLPCGVANAVRLAGLSLAEALRLSSTNPARVLGLERAGRGVVRVGASADLTVFRFAPGDPDLRVELTLVAGQAVYAAESGAA